MDAVKLPEGIYIGHADDGEKTGVTVMLAPDGAVGGVDVRGCAPGTRETDLLRPEKAIGKINAVVLSGGSAFGLAACAVYLFRKISRRCSRFKNNTVHI